MEEIPTEFYLADQPAPEVRTVGDLIEQLQRLPRELRLEKKSECVVYNYSDNAYFSLREPW